MCFSCKHSKFYAFAGQFLTQKIEKCHTIVWNISLNNGDPLLHQLSPFLKELTVPEQQRSEPIHMRNAIAAKTGTTGSLMSQ
jgi:hypothetical protein